MMPVVDEFTRECLEIEVERSLTAEDVVCTRAYLFRVHGEPQYLRSDNGPEFIAHAIQEWLRGAGVNTLYIEPGSPWQNAYVESFNGKIEDELLGRELFTSLSEAKVLVEQYRVEYNHERPHSALGYRTPAEFAATCALRTVASAPVGAPARHPHRGEQEASHSRTLITPGPEIGVRSRALGHRDRGGRR